MAAEAVEGHRDLAPVVLEPQLEERVELEVGEAQMKKGKEEGPPGNARKRWPSWNHLPTLNRHCTSLPTR